LVSGRRKVEHVDVLRPEDALQDRLVVGRISGNARLRVVLDGFARQVFRLEVDLAAEKCWVRDLSAGDVELALDLVAGVLQDLRVHLGEDLALAEAPGDPDGDGRAGGAVRAPTRPART